MKRFVFRLQTLLEYRETVEQMRLGELARLRRDEQLEQIKLQELRKTYEDACRMLFELADSGEHPWELANADDHCRALRDDISVQELSVDAARRASDAKLVEVVEAARNRKVLDQLRTRQKLEYETAAAKLEQMQIEDVSTTRYSRGAV